MVGALSLRYASAQEVLWTPVRGGPKHVPKPEHGDRGIMIQPVGKVEHLSYLAKLCERVRSLRSKGMVASQIARRLNEEGYRPPKRREGFDR